METLALTYKELADSLGVKVESARKAAQRKRWKRVIGNDGTARIHVPVEAVTSRGDSPSDSHGDSPRDSGPSPIHELQARIAVLETELAAERSARQVADAVRQSAEADRDRWHDQAQRLAERPGLIARLFGRKVA